MNEQGGSDFGRPGERDRFVARQVATLEIVVPRRSEGGLDEQEISPADGILDRARRAGVAGVRQAGAVGRFDDHAPGRDVVPAPHEPQSQVAHPQFRGRVVFDGVEGRIEEPVALADRDRQGIETSSSAGRQMDGQRVGGALAPRIQVAKADEIEEVICVHVADDDRRELMRIEELLEIPDDPLPDVEQQVRVAPLHEEPGGWGGFVGRGRTATEHGQTEARARGVSHHGKC